ncbi:hypothetical protein PIB30_066311 [Stylosanthes scabra]|uniref:protein-serine/threonine phosphatase n=1 Tax=Stylosanthes scabra TaxID=79078 RepID=A0ABU6VLV3_9FABA|nr:hypothetical protein [Stylosanthes scabra]
MAELKEFERFDVVSDHSDHYFSEPPAENTKKQKENRNPEASNQAARNCFSNTGSNVYKNIMREWKILSNGLPDSIYVRVYENRIDLMRAVIIGAAGTPYHDGLFFFDIAFPPNYPAQPPKVHYLSCGFKLNPNLYHNGEVCLSLINTWIGKKNERWDPCGSTTVLQLLVSLQGLVLNDKPFFNEAGSEIFGRAFFEKQAHSYNYYVFLLNCRTMLFWLQRPPRNFEVFVNAHFRDRACRILRACNEYVNGRVRVGWYGVSDAGEDAGGSPRRSRVKVSAEFKASMGKLYLWMVAAFQMHSFALCSELLQLENSDENGGSSKNKGHGGDKKYGKIVRSCWGGFGSFMLGRNPREVNLIAENNSKDQNDTKLGSAAAGGGFRVRVSKRCGMLQAFMNLRSLCLRPFGLADDNVAGSPVGVNSGSFRGSGSFRDGGGAREDNDSLLWSRDVGKYGSGDFSMAVVQGNQVLEDQSQIESGPLGTFVGIYDGHGGPDAARFVCDHLFRHFQAISAESNGDVTTETIERAFRQTEEGYTALVSDLWCTRPQAASAGTCCLVGVIFKQTLFVANLGDSRVVLGKKFGITGDIAAIQLSTEHNANLEAVRQELKVLHPDDPQIVVQKHGVWRVKGIIQISRSIGDVYMKDAKFNREPLPEKFRLPEPMHMPILSANPAIISRRLQPSDSFLIFASDGLWEQLSNEEAVEIVNSNPHSGSAKMLVTAALQEAARKREMRYSDLRKIDKKVRRHFHDDISVIVLFLNHNLISKGTVLDPPLSIRSELDH